MSSIWIKKFIYSIYSLVKIVLLSKPGYRIPVLEKEEIVVIGNAPSFGEDLQKYPDFFKSKELLCVNNFPSSENYERLQPRYIVLIDNGYYPANNKLLPWAEKTLNAIAEKTTWEVTLFIPQLARKADLVNSIPAKNKMVKINYYNYTVLDGFDWLVHRLFRANLGMVLCKNVIVAAIFISINMRYKKIYLTGVDNSFFKDIAVPKDNELYVSMSYFYAKDKDKHTGHFYNNLEKNEKMDVTDFFRWCYFSFLSYKKLKAYSKYQKVQVINTTIHSYIDAFEKKSIDEITES
ncbi:MAG TPA: hypothetical protein VNB90_08975 [Cytophagaceae bacterium]|nr:hypothetical protein [Cytophagaceae bacterium]